MKRSWVAFTWNSGLCMLGLLLAAECVLRTTHHQPPPPTEDPFVSVDSSPWLTESNDGSRALHPAWSDTFPAFPWHGPKETGERRVLCVGGSVVSGLPFGADTAFPRLLEAALSSADTPTTWSVCNAGGVAMPSYRLVPVLHAGLECDVDLVVLCLGHHEFLETRRGLPSVALRRSRLRVLDWMAWTLGHHPFRSEPSPQRPALSPQPKTWLDEAGAIDGLEREDVDRCAIVDHFAMSLRRMLSMARVAGVPVVVVSPPVSLRASPLRSVHRADLSPQDLAAWKREVGQARASVRTDAQAALAAFQRAIALDDEYALVHSECARVLEALGRDDEALAEHRLALRHDLAPVRITSEVEEAMRRVAGRAGVPCLDTAADFASHGSRESLLLDAIHPSIEGHRRIATRLFEWMIDEGFVASPLVDGAAQRAMQQVVDARPVSDHLRGVRRTEEVRAWLAGRAPRE